MKRTGDYLGNSLNIYFKSSNADGFDTNGAVNMNVNTVIINGPVSGANGILDYGLFTTTGSIYFGAGTFFTALAPAVEVHAERAQFYIQKEERRYTSSSRNQQRN